MKQIGTGIMMYVQDNDETYPLRYTAARINGRQTIWKDMVQPYIKNEQVYKCPSNQTSESSDLNGYWPGGYAMFLPDGPFGIGLFEDSAAYPQPLAGVQQPSHALVIVETSWRYPDIGPYFDYYEPAPTNDNRITPGPSSWNSGHNKKRGNIVYMDGHAKYTALKDTFREDGGSNSWRFTKAGADKAGRSWYYRVLTQLEKYPGAD
jgi:prepilin-type processing-associated H-X9-DG protein